MPNNIVDTIEDYNGVDYRLVAVIPGVNITVTMLTPGSTPTSSATVASDGTVTIALGIPSTMGIKDVSISQDGVITVTMDDDSTETFDGMKTAITAATQATTAANSAASSATSAASDASAAATSANNAATLANTAAEDAEEAAANITNQITNLNNDINFIAAAEYLYNSVFSVSDSIPSGSGIYKNIDIQNNIQVTGGDTIVVYCDVAANLVPSNFSTWLKISVIEYDTDNTAIKRTFIDSYSKITLQSAAVKIQFVVSYSYNNSSERYTETFAGKIRAYVDQTLELNDEINVPSSDIIAQSSLADISTIVLGALAGSTGAEIVSDTRIRSNFIRVYKNTNIYIVDNNYNFFVFRYALDGIFVSKSEAWISGSETIDSDCLIRIMVRKSNDAVITNNEVQSIADKVKIFFANIPQMLIDDINEDEGRISKLETNSLESLEYNDIYYINGILRRVYNPYKDKGESVLSGQLHCHVRYLDDGVIKYYNNGDMNTAMSSYVSSGYDFITITDYGFIGEITAPTQQELPQDLVWMFNSCESPFDGSGDNDKKPPRHMCVYNITEPLSYRNNWMSAQDFADIAKPTGKIVTLAHPFYVGTYQPPAVVSQIKERVRFCEIYNGLCAWHEAQGDDWIVTPTGKDTDYAWEIMLDNGLVTWGIAVSDAHSTTGISDIKNGCVKVFCDSDNVSREEILKNLSLGNFYSVTNIDTSITDISFANGTYTITTGDSGSTIQFMKENGTVLSTTTGSSASYTMTGLEQYVRAKIIMSNGEKVWTQPVVNIFKPDYDNYF